VNWRNWRSWALGRVGGSASAPSWPGGSARCLSRRRWRVRSPLA